MVQYKQHDQGITIPNLSLKTKTYLLCIPLSISQPAEGVLGNVIIPLSGNNGLLLILAFRKDEFTQSPAVGQGISTSYVRDVVSRILQTSPIQLIFCPSVHKCAIYIWEQLDDRVEM